MKVVIILVVALSILFCFDVVDARTWYIKADGMGDAPTIQAGIDSCSTGDTVLVASGTYTGVGNKDVDFNGKTILVTSEKGADSTIIDCENSGRGFYFHNGEDSLSIVSGLTITGGNATDGGAISCENESSPTITDCIIEGNNAGVNGGGIWSLSFSPIITNCIIRGNHADHMGGGLCCVNSSEIIGCIVEGNSVYGYGGGIWCGGASSTIINCTIVGNRSYTYGGGIIAADDYVLIADCNIEGNSSAGQGGGILLECDSALITNCTIVADSAETYGGGICCEYSDALITNCTIVGNNGGSGGGISCHSGTTIENTIVAFSTAGGGISCGSAEPSVSCCDVYGNAGGDYACANVDTTNCISEDPLFCDTSEADYRISTSSPCAPENNVCGVLMGAWGVGCGVTWYIKDDGTGDASTIQAGIDSASAGDTVLVADGTYTGDGNRDIDFRGKTISVVSENGSEFTIIDCQGTYVNPHRGFYFHRGEDSLSFLSGFTITGGYAEAGGGICCDSSSSPVISNCSMEGNIGDWGGGGVSCSDSSSPTITNCTMEGNGGGYWGGGIFCHLYSSPIITDCNIKGNKAGQFGGGITIVCSSSPVITNCIVTEDTSEFFGGGIYCFEYCAPTISNCTIARNDANEGGGIWCETSPATITNCTVVGNSGLSAGGITCSMSDPVIENTIIAFSTAGAGMDCDAGSNPSLSCCDVYGNAGGDYSCDDIDTTNCISEDPLFCDTSQADYHIFNTSPCAPENNVCEVLIGAREVGCYTFIRGDANGDGVIDVGDVVFLVSYLYRNGPAPDPLWVGDANSDDIVDVGDIVYLVSYLYRGGPPPSGR